MVKVGDKFGRLTVQKLDHQDTHYRKFWTCQCDCGNQCCVRQDHLLDGHVKSCGCLNYDRINDLTGQVFDKLLVIEPTERRSCSGDVYWKCLCVCGEYCFKTGSDLKRKDQHEHSCGCIASPNTKEISAILRQYSIDFQREYQFPDLIQKRNLRFDFGIMLNNQLLYVIEYDGSSHMKANAKKMDNIKNQYCTDHNIPLIRITEKQIPSLTIQDLVPEQFRLLLSVEGR